MASPGIVDYYELLQISPNADSETIHRVYRFLAARVHPDHAETADPEMFRMLKAAYDVLSDPRRRTAYDVARKPPTHEPLSSKVDFMDERDGELNRRLAVLAVLYHRRRSAPNFPEVPLAELEERMGFPRDYLDFTLWYLLRKGYLMKADNAQFALTAEGVDFVESERAKIPVLNRLLTSSTPATYPSEAPQSEETDAAVEKRDKPALETHPEESEPIVLPAELGRQFDRRVGKVERRVGLPDMRRYKVERRKGERRGSAADRRTVGE